MRDADKNRMSKNIKPPSILEDEGHLPSRGATTIFGRLMRAARLFSVQEYFQTIYAVTGVPEISYSVTSNQLPFTDQLKGVIIGVGDGALTIYATLFTPNKSVNMSPSSPFHVQLMWGTG